MKNSHFVLLVFFCLAVYFLFQQQDLIPSNNQDGQSDIPTYVMEVLEQVESTGRTFKGYVGGRTFQNREKRLPKKEANGKKIKYKEWDVHKKVKGKNRGAERLVTGSDGRAYYTDDHYGSFIQINGPPRE